MKNIVENKHLNPELVKNVDPDLQPTKKRIMDPVSYAWGDAFPSERSLWVLV